MTTEYLVLARKYRPQTFKDVLGQDHIVQTLKNAIKNHRLAHAYLFCGSRGTGKTTLARVFAKALNCQMPTKDLEPCNTCASCKEITAGHSLDVLEIDGASHRGIDDIRQINETVGYTCTSGKYKIYIIDEVHMLTKEAFNALLKTLEEPPAKVKFFFATTEPHKVLPTILSRCQRFNLNRIPLQSIMQKLKFICDRQLVNIQEDAIRLLAQRAEGGLRDAESLLDQIISFQEGEINASCIANILGVMPRQVFFEIDVAAKDGEMSKAFEIAERIFSEGKDLGHFIEGLIEHFRTLTLVKISGKDAVYLDLIPEERDRYEASAKFYTQEQTLFLLDMLTEAQQQIRFAPAPRIALETILLKILRVHERLPIEFLVRRLAELEQEIKQSGASLTANEEIPSENQPIPAQELPSVAQETAKELVAPLPPTVAEPVLPVKADREPLNQQAITPLSITEDPTPSPEDLGRKKSAPQPIAVKTPPPPVVAPSVQALSTPLLSTEENKKKQNRYDTLLQFAAVELEGTLQKKPNVK